MKKMKSMKILSLLMAVVLMATMPLGVLAETVNVPKETEVSETQTAKETETGTEIETVGETEASSAKQKEAETAQSETVKDSEKTNGQTTAETEKETAAETETEKAAESEKSSGKKKQETKKKTPRGGSSGDVIDLGDSDAELAAAAAASSKYSFDGGAQRIDINAGPVTVKGATTIRQVRVTGNSTVTFDNVSIQHSADDCGALEVNASVHLTLVLVGDNNLKSGNRRAGIKVSSLAQLTITAADTNQSLTAIGGEYGAGIGGQWFSGSGGTIHIENGTVNAQGGNYAAGIGGSWNGSPGNGDGGVCKITGGVVNARGAGGAGIGGGISGAGGTVEISAGIVNATGGGGGAGIGGGAASGSYPSGGGGTINITGGIITASGGNGAGIGSGGGSSSAGTNGNAGIITISGGVVKASAGPGAEIGPGRLGTTAGSSIVIAGGSIDAARVIPGPIDGSGRNVYRNTLKVGKVNTEQAISSGRLDGVIMSATANPAAGIYGINHVRTDSSGKVYFWLPENNTPSAKVSVTSGGEDYSLIYPRDNQAQTRTLQSMAPDIMFPSASNITFGKVLSESTLSGGTSGRGGFSWVVGTVQPPVGTNAYEVVFTPSDLEYYDYSMVPDWDSSTRTVRRNVNITVDRAPAQDVVFPTASGITYEEQLADSVLSGGTTGRGDFEWEDDSIVPDVTNSGYTVVFTPNDLNNYDYSGVTGWDSTTNTVRRTVDITVNPADAAEVIFPTAAELTYEATLADSVLSGGTADRGNFAWEDDTIVPTVINSGYTVVFTPDDTDNYDYGAITGWDSTTRTVRRTVSITVNPAAAEERTFPTAAELTYEATLAESALSGGTAGRGDFAWVDGSVVPTVTNSGYVVVFTPADPDNYDYSALPGWDSATRTIRRTVAITVKKALITEVNFPEPTPVTYGMTLADSILGGSLLKSAVASGSFAWEDGKIVPIVLNNGYMAVFTPADTDNYDYTGVAGWDDATKTVRRTVALTVNKAIVAEVDVKFPKAGAIMEGDTLEFSELTGGSTELGSFAWEDDKIVPTVKNKGYTVVFTPDDTDNYDYSQVSGWDEQTKTVRRIVAVKVTAETPTEKSYTITVESSVGGTASASVKKARAGKQITLTARAASGYRFKEWQVVKGDIKISGGKFKMPAENVRVKAVFEKTSGTNSYVKRTYTGTSRNPKTGDNTLVWPFVLLGFAALATIAAVGVRRKKHTDSPGKNMR